MVDSYHPAAARLFDVMSTTRAIRRFTSDPVPEDVIRSVIEAASYAPSGGNLQQWRVVIVTDRRQLAKLGPLWRKSWSQYLERFSGGDEDLTGRQHRGSAALAAAVEQLPAIAIFCHYPGLIGFTDAALDRPSMVGGASLHPAVQKFLLACHAHGLGAVLTTTLCLVEPEVAAVLHLPQSVGIHAAVPFGYPDKVSHGPLSRRPVERLAHRDSWDTRFE